MPSSPGRCGGFTGSRRPAERGDHRQTSRLLDVPAGAEILDPAEIEICGVEFLQLQGEELLIQSAHVTERFTIRRNALTCCGLHSSHSRTGISLMPNLRAPFRCKWPSITSPSLRASTGILKPNSLMLLNMRSTAASFFHACRKPVQVFPATTVSACPAHFRHENDSSNQAGADRTGR
jgi:hypothetical protein